MEGGENHEPPRFCIVVNVLIGGWKLDVLQLHHATLQSAVEATVDLLCKIVCSFLKLLLLFLPNW